jgi:hypothetical protein
MQEMNILSIISVGVRGLPMVAGGSGGFGVIKVDKLKKVGLQSLLFGIH